MLWLWPARQVIQQHRHDPLPRGIGSRFRAQPQGADQQPSLCGPGLKEQSMRPDGFQIVVVPQHHDRVDQLQVLHIGYYRASQVEMLQLNPEVAGNDFLDRVVGNTRRATQKPMVGYGRALLAARPAASARDHRVQGTRLIGHQRPKPRRSSGLARGRFGRRRGKTRRRARDAAKDLSLRSAAPAARPRSASDSRKFWSPI